METAVKKERLNAFFRENLNAALGFSGGVDSAYLLWAGVQAGAQIRPYFIKTVFQPAFELEDARRLAGQIGVELTVIELNILAEPQVAANPKNRCYSCKKALFGALKRRAAEDGISVLLDGTNASDNGEDRPGMQAIAELEVRSPLRECGLTKAEIREESKKAGLFTWNKPAYACLATRIPAGQEITARLLEKVEQGEDALMRMGFSDFRIRLFGEAARIQIPAGQMEKAVEQRKEILRALRPWFGTVLLDLQEREASVLTYPG